MDSLCKNYCFIKTNLNINRSFFKKKLKQNCTNLEMQPIFKIWPILIINKLIPIQFAHRIRINPPPPPKKIIKRMTRKALEIQCIQESLPLVTLWIYIVQHWSSCSFKGLVQSDKETAAEKERQTDQASRNANEVRNFGHGGNPAHHGGERHCSLLIEGMGLVEETIVTWVLASFVSSPEKTRSILMLFNFKILSSHRMDSLPIPRFEMKHCGHLMLSKETKIFLFAEKQGLYIMVNWNKKLFVFFLLLKMKN